MGINMTPKEFLFKLMIAIMLITVGTSLLATAILEKHGGYLWSGIAVFSVFLTMYIPLVVFGILPDDDGCPLFRYSDDDYKTAIVYYQ